MRWLLLFLVLWLISSASAVVINEILPDPIGEEPDGEWIELYTNQSESLVNWSVSDAAGKSYNFSVSYNSFAVLTCNASTFNQSYPNLNVPIVDLNCTGIGWLNNGAESLFLYDSAGALISSFTCESSPGENKSWASTPDGAENFTKCDVPTPGLANACADEEEPPPEEDQYDLELEIKIQNATEGVKAKNLFRLTNLDYVVNQPYMNVTVEFIVKLNDEVEYEDEFTVQFKQTKSTGTGNWTPQSFGEYRLCGKITDYPFEDNDEGNNDACGDITVYENLEEEDNSTDENLTLGLSLRNSTANASAKSGRNYTIGNYTWTTKTTPSTAVLLFVGVLLILVVSLLLTAAGTKR